MGWGSQFYQEIAKGENQKGKFMSRLWHLIAANLFLPLLVYFTAPA